MKKSQNKLSKTDRIIMLSIEDIQQQINVQFTKQELIRLIEAAYKAKNVQMDVVEAIFNEAICIAGESE